ncbi:peptidase inhibitor family I36 protein [Sanguibacter inulinus]|uniref:Peptidase inhibitor family I36 protein n=1 Tax=Sanguibacter inulinus TaxID=60922 RepID=A0A853EW70_9MICO|nr:peptidase inhibitor family I36 protein [Sanguibacter inulinus]MBF0723525.1 peptidase inhibitor family I36 protein [Sanguibacter inulinus]NYS94670.1 peptidase inhibitor family I36 protein [Sanguibacter inulinus]
MNTVKAHVAGRHTSWRLVAMVAVVTLLGFAPVTASASDGVGESDGSESVVQLFSEAQCTSGAFCVWSEPSFAGIYRGVASTAPLSTGFVNSKSLWNRSSRAARVYSGTGGTGSWVCYTPSMKIASLSVPARSVALLASSSC